VNQKQITNSPGIYESKRSKCERTYIQSDCRIRTWRQMAESPKWNAWKYVARRVSVTKLRRTALHAR